MKKYFVTKKGHDNLYKKYLDIDKEIIDTNKKIGISVKMDNDLRENPEFMQLRVKIMYELPKKKNELYEKYYNALIIEDLEEYKNFDHETVIMGSKVCLNFDGEICNYVILGTDEGNHDEDIISCESPIAKLLLGNKTRYKTQFNGISIEILSVEKYYN